MIHSMTGFGRSQGTFEGVGISVEINSVNRRNLETSVSMPREWQSLERVLLTKVREALSRGKVHMAIQVEPCRTQSGFQWEVEGFQSTLTRLKTAVEKEGLQWEPSADALVRIAALNKIDFVLPAADVVESSLVLQVETAVEELLAMRAAEGRSLSDDLLQRIKDIQQCLEIIERETAERPPRYRDLLMDRLAQAGLDIDLSDERVLKEIAIFADRCDITEEITRLKSHFSQFTDCLKEGSPIGRKLEFILQEVNREFNTIGSKGNNVDISRQVIEAKHEIERNQLSALCSICGRRRWPWAFRER